MPAEIGGLQCDENLKPGRDEYDMATRGCWRIEDLQSRGLVHVKSHIVDTALQCIAAP